LAENASKSISAACGFNGRVEQAYGTARPLNSFFAEGSLCDCEKTFLGLEPIRNILEFTLEPNVTAPLSTMR